MALSLARLCLIRASNTALKKFITPSAFSITGNNFFVHKKFISTTNKQKDTIAVDKGHVENSIYGPETENLRDKDENWMSYGYDMVDRDMDEFANHLVMFTAFTIVICGCVFFFAYFPDFNDVAWAQREAYLELDKRQRLGLPLIDPNYVPPEKIQLLSDEELKDFDIII